MAPKIKVTYFDVMALGEPIRYLLSYGGLTFEDDRFKEEDWPNLKKSMPFGKVPVIEIDGKKANQSISICRYISKLVGLSGANDWENLQIDSTVETMVDLRVANFNAFFAEDGKEKKIETFKNETLPFYFDRLDTQVKENGGYLVNKKLTWADLHFAATVETINGCLKSNSVEKYSNLSKLVDKVWELPKIKEWRAKRPITDL